MLYHPDQQKDNCGFGLIAQLDDQCSHEVVAKAIHALARLTHRGAMAADGLTGDGCGILLKMPRRFIQKVAQEAGWVLAERFAVGMIFCPDDMAKIAQIKQVAEKHLSARKMIVAGWRDVPMNAVALGEEAKRTQPKIIQLLLNCPDDISLDECERQLFIVRQKICNELRHEEDFYICSLSTQTLIYKGLLMPSNLPVFYPDLADPDMQSSLAIFHQRFSTNTVPRWRLAQPFRLLAHNGEINTINANRDWARSRLVQLLGERFPELAGMRTVVNETGSDSSSLDNMLQLLVAGGMEIKRALRILIPPAWQNMDNLDPDLRAFYAYNSMHMEPWDGPAGVVLTDGRFAGCALDRNGLRPARYVISKDRHLVIASENGTCDIPESDIIEKGRVRAGELLMVDLHKGEVHYPEAINTEMKTRAPYRQWLKTHTHPLRSIYQQDTPTANPMASDVLSRFEKMFDVTREEKIQVLRAMVEDGQEAIGSMGDDTPMAVLSQQPRPFYDYFRQLFAQVTNPPIDSLREASVMSLQTILGSEYCLFRESESQAKRMVLESPILSEGLFKALLDIELYPVQRFDLCYDPSETDLHRAIQQLCEQAAEAVRGDKSLLIFSDKNIAKNQIPIPAMLATGCVHQYLIEQDLRGQANIVVKTASARDPHHMACLLGVGATLIYPYLAHELIQSLLQSKAISLTPTVALNHYHKALNKGLYKILSKMGISTLAGYRGSQLFEAVGISKAVVQLAFPKMSTRMDGLTWADLDAEQRHKHTQAFDARSVPNVGGVLKYMQDGEYHAYNPDVVQTLQRAVQTGEPADYQIYANAVNGRSVTNIRDLLQLKSSAEAVPIGNVEPASALFKRFDSAAMSLGALSPEAHETLAQAMNELGGRSNSGEGGEDEARYHSDKVSKIKQIASGRFGVTPYYLMNAEVLQIKIAQGAKPGEGGQLPGHKVNALIARLRYAKEGVTLISPPPHHDIYSIEDLAQLIFDLKQVNPEALVSVKLVSAPGVGTIAAGVAKAYADLITISGYDGGTGASPLTSIRYAGSPWELGLAEAHQALCENHLRDKVILQTDGGLKTGLDVIKAAILGAETFGFGTGPMIAMGCKYLRICHLNNCATGIATQNAILREQHFVGTKERVKNYFGFIAEEVRQHLANLGVTSLEAIIGQTDLLERLETVSERHQRLDLQPMLAKPTVARAATTFTKSSNAPPDQGVLNQQILADAKANLADKSEQVLKKDYPIANTDRSVGATLSGYLAKNLGREVLHAWNTPRFDLHFRGSAGQSFGVWNADGILLTLHGEANDYVGKGMAGGRITVLPDEQAGFVTQGAPIVGNTCLYGATGGEFFAAGSAGERFAVRNSGATAVVEGAGDHCCEYMTGGAVVVLGSVGVNFGAGMTGGLAFVLDEDKTFFERVNKESVELYRLNAAEMREHKDFLEQLIERYVTHSQSTTATQLLDEFAYYSSHFWMVAPKSQQLSNLLNQFIRAA